MSLSFLQSIALADAQRTLSPEHNVVTQPSHFRFSNLAFAVRCGILQINVNPIVTQHVRRINEG